jgi:hypothetical protein
VKQINKSNYYDHFIVKILLKFLKFLWINISFILLTLVALKEMRDLHICYSFLSVIICPYKTWSLVLAFYLRHKCSNLNEKYFSKYLNTKHQNDSQRD